MVLLHTTQFLNITYWKALQCCAYSPFTNLEICLKTDKIVTFPLIYKILTAEAIIRISVFIICCICGFKKETYLYPKYYHGPRIMLHFLPWSGHHHFLLPQTLGFSLSVLLTVQLSCWSPESSCLALTSHYSSPQPVLSLCCSVTSVSSQSNRLPAHHSALFSKL